MPTRGSSTPQPQPPVQQPDVAALGTKFDTLNIELTSLKTRFEQIHTLLKWIGGFAAGVIVTLILQIVSVAYSSGRITSNVESLQSAQDRFATTVEKNQGEFQKSITDLTISSNKYEANLISTKSIMDRESKDLRERHGELAGLVGSTRTALDAHAAKIESYATRINDVSSQVESQTNKLKAVASQLDTATEELRKSSPAQLSTSLDIHRKKLEDLAAKIEESPPIKDLKDLKKVQDDISSLSQQIRVLAGQVNELQTVTARDEAAANQSRFQDNQIRDGLMKFLQKEGHVAR